LPIIDTVAVRWGRVGRLRLIRLQASFAYRLVTISRPYLARDFKFGTRICMWNAALVHK